MTQMRTRFLRTLLVFVALALPAVGFAADDKPPTYTLDKYAGKAWESVRDELAGIIKRTVKHDSLPESAWFATDKKSNQSKIDSLMEEALSHLGISNLTGQRAKYNALEEAIRECQSDIGKCAEKRVSAPEETGFINGLWATTRVEYDKKITTLKAKITLYGDQQAALLEKMQKELEGMGIKLTKRQMSNLLLTVSGDSFMDLSSSFHNIKQLTGLLGKLVDENKEYVQSAKKYYGMYVALVAVLSHAHERAIGDIDSVYMPRIKEIVAHTEATMEKTKDLMVERSEDADALDRLARNLSAQKFFLKAGGSYLRYLERQRARFVAAKATVDKHYQVAYNTYETVDIASSMLNVMKASIKDFAALQSMQLPEMQPLQTEKVRRQFQIISDQLRDR
jgi:hypothetical protein